MPANSSPAGSEGSSLDFARARDELAISARKLTRVREWLARTVVACEEESRTMQSEVSELKMQRNSDSELIEALRNENEALKRSGDPLDDSRVQKLLGERDLARQKLRRTREILQDLLEETKSEYNDDLRHVLSDLTVDYRRGSNALGLTQIVSTTSPKAEQLSTGIFHGSGSISPINQEGHDVRSENPPTLSEVRMGKKKATSTRKLPKAREESFVTADTPKSGSKNIWKSSSSTASTHRVRDTKTPELNSPRVFGQPSAHASPPSVTPKRSVPSSPLAASTAGGRTPTITGQWRASSSGSAASSRAHYEAGGSRRTSSGAASDVDVRQPPRSHIGGPSGTAEFYVQCTRVPSSADLVVGPLSDEDLKKYVELSVEDATPLSRLSTLKGHRLRVFIEGQRAFLFQPLILETPTSSYVVEWGTDDANRETLQYITAREDLVFHTFIYPKKRNAWYYIGALQWKLTERKDIYANLHPKAMLDLVQKVRERSPDESGVAEIADMIADRRLKQLCFELKGDIYMESSVAFREEIWERMRVDE